MYIVLNIVNIILSLFEICLFVRAICSWVPSFRNSRVYELSCLVTEPVLRPFKDFFYRFEWARRCPIDISFLVVVLLVNGLMTLIGYLY